MSFTVISLKYTHTYDIRIKLITKKFEAELVVLNYNDSNP